MKNRIPARAKWYRTLKYKLPKYRLEKKLHTAANFLIPHVSLHAVEELIENLGLKHPIIFDVNNLGEYYP